MERFDVVAVRSQFGMRVSEARERIDLAAKLPPNPSAKVLDAKGADTEFKQSGFAQIVPKKSADAKKLADALNRDKAVWKAYVAPRPEPAGVNGSAVGTRLFEPAQGYLYSAPDGVGAAVVWGLAGAMWQVHHHLRYRGRLEPRAHEDLPSGIPLLGGTPDR